MKSLSFCIFLVNVLLLLHLIAAQGTDCELYNSIVNGNIVDCCNEANIKCNNGRIVFLDLMNKQLSNINPNIGKLTEIEYLDLEGNKLTNLPDEISKLTKLKHLYLINNQLNTVPNAITKLTGLEDLDLSTNKLTSIPEEIFNLINLKTLVLNQNNLGTISPSVGNLSNLKELYLSEVGLTSLPEEVSQLAQLEKLTVSKNKLTSLPNNIFNLKLKLLYIYDNPDLNIKLINFANAPIEFCDIRNIKITCYQKGTCKEIADMTESSLNICTDEEIEEVKNLTEDPAKTEDKDVSNDSKNEKESKDSKGAWIYILIFVVFGVLLVVLLTLSCIVIKNIFKDKKEEEEFSNYHISSAVTPKYNSSNNVSTSDYQLSQNNYNSNFNSQSSQYGNYRL